MRLFDTRSLEADEDVPIVTGYPAAVTDISLSGDRRWMAAATSEFIVLSDLQKQHRIGREVLGQKAYATRCLDRGQRSAQTERCWPGLIREATPGHPRIRLWDFERAKGNREL